MIDYFRIYLKTKNHKYYALSHYRMGLLFQYTDRPSEASRSYLTYLNSGDEAYIDDVEFRYDELSKGKQKYLTGKLPLPSSQNRLPEPKLLTPSLGNRLPTTPILRPKPLKTLDTHSVEPVLIPEKEIEAEVPMLDINFGSETGMSEETDFARKLKDNQEIKQAEKEYNIHIQAMVQPKLGGFDPELFVRIELEIETSGKITSFRLLEQSSSNSFNQAAELAIRNANLNPLPKALAKNPPYIVVVRIIPPIQ